MSNFRFADQKKGCSFAASNIDLKFYRPNQQNKVIGSNSVQQRLLQELKGEVAELPALVNVRGWRSVLTCNASFFKGTSSLWETADKFGLEKSNRSNNK